ncbi:hypothetical protein [Mycolicibacterium thermoresistibile]|nr:hypothetical protein [Mycolicibacterium thermoresistibile]GAT15570.1 putative uncharacterized protein [Mycolicibacterium thermoresistibile]SNW16879.1 Uncharacterised protein [Mycolicibacterium thermoresistibile]
MPGPMSARLAGPLALAAALTAAALISPGPAAAAPGHPDRRCAEVPYVGVCVPMWERPNKSARTPVGQVLGPLLTVDMADTPPPR